MGENKAKRQTVDRSKEYMYRAEATHVCWAVMWEEQGAQNSVCSQSWKSEESGIRRYEGESQRPLI